MGSSGWVRSNSWICVFSSTQSTIALSGGFRYRPTMSLTFSTKNGSVEILKCFCRCGCTEKVCNQRCTVVLEIPVTAAKVRALQ